MRKKGKGRVIWAMLISSTRSVRSMGFRKAVSMEKKDAIEKSPKNYKGRARHIFRGRNSPKSSFLHFSKAKMHNSQMFSSLSLSCVCLRLDFLCKNV